MATRDPQTNPAAFFGVELRRARMTAGFTSQEALAARLGFDRSVVAKAETGERPPTAEVLAGWCAACQLDGDLFGRLAVLARQADGPVPKWFEDWLDAVREAHTLRIWSPTLIPGLLQIAEYARALFFAAGADEESADGMVLARLERQTILDRRDPPHVVVVVDESALHRLIGSPAIMADQLTRMAGVSEQLHVSVHVLPAVGANAGLYRVSRPVLSSWRQQSNGRVGRHSLAEIQLQRKRRRQLRGDRNQPARHRARPRLQRPRRTAADP
jgi:transcriptional regulator with XRE-family HTH domain